MSSCPLQEGDRTQLFIFPLLINQLILVPHLLLGGVRRLGTMSAPWGCGSQCHGPSERRRGALLWAGEGWTLTRMGVLGGRGTGIRSGQGVWWHQQLPAGLATLCCPPCHGRRSCRGPCPLLALMSAVGRSPNTDCPGVVGAGAGGRGGHRYLIPVKIKIPADAHPAPLLSMRNAMLGPLQGQAGCWHPQTPQAVGGCPWAEHGSSSACGGHGITAGLVALVEDPGSGTDPRFQVL